MDTVTRRPIKVLHAPFNFANQPYILSQALRDRGIDSHLLRYQWEGNAGSTKFQYSDDRIADISIKDWFGDLLRVVQSITAEGFDIVHLWNRSLLWRGPNEFFNGLDLPFIRLAGPRLAYRFTGYELRRKSLELEVNPFSPFRYGFESRFKEDDQKRYLDYLERYVQSFVVQDPEMQTYCPQACIIPRALNLSEFPMAEPVRNERPIVVHAPSHQLLKGSEFVAKAVDTLKEEDCKFDYVQIENMPNAEALEHYRRADIIIDQLLIGWYGVLSMEAMAMGKTVIVYIRDDLTNFFSDGMPLLNANPETILEVLRQAINDHELRRAVSARARTFVEQVHDSKIVAAETEALYKRMLNEPDQKLIPDLSYQINKSSDFVQIMAAPAEIRTLKKQLKTRFEQVVALRKEVRSLRAEGTAAEPTTVNASPSFVDAEEQIDTLRKNLETLRYDAQQYLSLKPELPSLRYKAKRYDELKNVALLWRAKADRYDRLARSGFIKLLLLPLLGWSFRHKSKRSNHPKPPADSKDAATEPRGADQGAPAGGNVEASGRVSKDKSGDIEQIRAILRIGKIPTRAGRPATKDDRERPLQSQMSSQTDQAEQPDRKGLVCIVSRKAIRSVTRAPRMAKALTDAGYQVVVVSLARPVPQLEQMCPSVEYLEVRPPSLIAVLRRRCDEFRRKRNEHGPAPTSPAKWLAWRLLVALPASLLLRKPSQGFRSSWREFVQLDGLGVAEQFARTRRERFLTEGLAEAADKATRGRRFDIVQAYDNYALVAAQRLAARDGAKLIYDAVELASHRIARDLNFIERRRERADRREEAHIIRRIDGMITIGDGLAKWYARRYPVRPLVVRNCRYFWPYQVDTRLRCETGVGPDVRLVVWVGSLYPDQGIESLIRTLVHLEPHIHAAVIGFTQPTWARWANEELPALCKSLGVADRVHFLPAREPNDIVPFISGADLGIIPRPRGQLNNFFSMPNKFLEMVMARLPVAVSQLGDMVDVIRKYEIGLVFDERDPANAASVIGQMLEPLTFTRLKANVEKAAEIFCWEKESQPYIELVTSLMPPAVQQKPIASRMAAPQDAATGTVQRAKTSPGGPKVANSVATAQQPSLLRRRFERRGKLIEENVNLSTKLEHSTQAYYQAATANQKLRDALNAMRSSNEFYRETAVVAHYLRFARYCLQRAEELKADAYIAHGVEVLPAADAIAEAVGGRVYCDVIEMPSFSQRSVQLNWHLTNLSLLDHAFDSYLRGAAGLSTVGWALKEKIRHYGPPVTVIPNYRAAEPLQYSDQLRQRCGLGPEDRLVLASSTMASGLVPVIEALTLLPGNVHLATLGNFVRGYRDEVEGAVARADVAHLVHFFDPVPYDQFASVASGADVGLIAVDPSLMHWQISLPNRLFDCIAGSLPVVTPDLPDVVRIVREWNMGVVLATDDARGWADAIAAALADQKRLRRNVQAASKALTWDRLGDDLHAAYDHAESVTIIGFHDLVDHQRTIRMAETLLKRGVKVTICCPRDGPAPAERPGLRYVLTPKPMPNGPGSPVATAPPRMTAGAATTGEPINARTPRRTTNANDGRPITSVAPATKTPNRAPTKAAAASVKENKAVAAANTGAPLNFRTVRKLVAGAAPVTVTPDFVAIRKLIAERDAASTDGKGS